MSLQIDWVQWWSLLPTFFFCLAIMFGEKKDDKIFMAILLFILWGPVFLRIWKII